MKFVDKTFYFESDSEIKDFIIVLKKMRKSKISLWRSLSNGYGLHNGKACIPDFQTGHKICRELREGN